MIIHESRLPRLGEFDENTLQAFMKVMKILDNGFREIDERKLGVAFQKSLREFEAKERADYAADTERQKREEQERAAAEARAVNEAVGKRLKEWVAAGLLEDQHNENLLMSFLQRNSHLAGAAGLDVAIQGLAAELHWAVWAPHLQPKQEESQVAEEVLGRLKTGEKQLPLVVSEAEFRAASNAQRRDWLERKRKAENSQFVLSQGSHGVSF